MWIRPGLRRCGPLGDIIKRGRTSFVTLSELPHKRVLNAKFVAAHHDFFLPCPITQSKPDVDALKFLNLNTYCKRLCFLIFWILLALVGLAFSALGMKEGSDGKESSIGCMSPMITVFCLFFLFFSSISAFFTAFRAEIKLKCKITNLKGLLI